MVPLSARKAAIALIAVCACFSPQAVLANGEAAEPAGPPMTAERAGALIAQLTAEEIEDATAAADELAQAGDAALPFVLKAAKATNETLRQRIAGILGRIDNPAALGTLCEMLEDESDAVRREAICAVGNQGQPESAEKLEGFLLAKNPLLRLEAAMALGRIGGESALPALRRSCLDDDHRVRKAAVVALALMGDGSAVPVLISRLRDENKMVRTLAHLVLKTMCDTDFGFDPDDEEEKRNEAVKLWETWWETYKKGDTGGNTRKEQENEK